MLSTALLLASLALLPHPQDQRPPTTEEILAAYEQSGVRLQKGPCDGDMGEQAHLSVPEGCYFLDGPNAIKLLELNENLTSGHEVGALWHAGTSRADSWWVFFEFAQDGYVEDEDREIDADGLMENMKEGNRASNEERRKRGWSELHLTGWQKPPFYDPRTNNLTWATLLQGDTGKSVNWSTRLLGREGVMSVDLVLAPESLESALPVFETLLGGFEYKSGRKYAEFKAGDKIAEYGLAALVAGGAGALALKTGLFAKLWKFLLIPIVAAGAFLKRLFTGRRKEGEPGGPSA